jgi:hypothetical protein
MAATVTVPTRATAFTGSGTITNIVPTAGLSGFSLHDCADPGQVGAHNEIWPRGNSAAGPIAFTRGVAVHHRNPQDPSLTVAVSKA